MNPTKPSRFLSTGVWVIYGIVVLLTSLFVFSRPNKTVSHPSADDIRGLLCVTNSSTVGRGSLRDVLFLYATNGGVGLEMCIQSLRSTGCGARIILFVAPSFRGSRTFMRMVELMKVELVANCGTSRGRPLVPHMLRFEYELSWLKKNINDVDRILHSDAFDVFFQGDPFVSDVPKKGLAFVVEPHQFRSCGWNLGWMESCYRKRVRKMVHHFIICSGSISGAADSYISLLELMTSQPEWALCWGESKDQPILNYLVWNGLVDAAGISYTLTGCDGGFFTVQWCVIGEAKINEHNQIVSEMNTVPSYIHQYNRLDSLTDFLQKKCAIRI